MSDNKKKKSLSDLNAYRAGELNEAQEDQLLEAYFMGEERLRLKKIAENMNREEYAPPISTPHPIIRIFKPVYVRAAVLLLTAGVSYLSVTQYTKYREDQEMQAVVAEIHQAQNGVEKIGQNLLGGESHQATWQELYKKQQYSEVVALLDEATVKDPEIFFYLGLSSFKKQPADYEKAVRCFLNVKKLDFKVTEAQWWLAMAYYQQGKWAVCETALLEIKPRQYKYEVAQQFLAQLKKKK